MIKFIIAFIVCLFAIAAATDAQADGAVLALGAFLVKAGWAAYVAYTVATVVVIVAAAAASYGMNRIVASFNTSSNDPFSQAASQLSLASSDFTRGILLNRTSNNDPIPVIYGSRTIGGTRVFLEATGDSNEYLHIVLAMCEGPISAINTVYLNDVPTTDSRFSGLVDVYRHLGGDDQLADSALIAATPLWTENHRLRGVAYLYIRLKYDQDAFSGGMPTITSDVDGRTVYDPRDGLTKFSRNFALCVRDYCSNTRYGRGIPAVNIPDAYITSAANYSDELVSVGGGSQARYTCDGVINIDDGAMPNIKKLLSAGRGMLIFSAGLYKLVIDRPETASFDFTEDNITGSWTISLGTKKNMYNRLRGNFFNPDRSWQPDISPVESTALRVLDNGLILERQIDLPFTANINTVRQLLTIALNQSRQQISCQFTAFISGLRCEVGDVVTITHTTPGWTAKEFRILNLTLKNNDEIVVIAQEYDVTAYDYGTINIVDATPNTNLPDMTATAAPVDLQVVEELYYTATGKGVQVRANLTWEASPDAFVTSYDVAYKESSADVWVFSTTTKSRAAVIYDLAPSRYDFRVRGINTMGVASSWTVLPNVLLAGLTTPPADIEGLVLRPLEGQAHLQWTRAVEMDVLHGGYIKVRYANLQSGATWAGGQDIGPALAGSSTNAVLPLMPGTYMVKAVDSTGNWSTNAAMIVTNVPSILSMNFVDSQDEAPAFAGSKTNLVVDGVTLKLDVEPFNIEQENGDAIITEVCGVRWRMTAENGDDLITEDGDDLQQEEYEVSYGAGGDTIANDEWSGADTVWTSGTYLFASGIDLGAVYLSRVWSDFQYSGYQINDLIDNRSLTMDEWPNWDGEAIEFTGATLYVRTTLNDPAASPVWTSWMPFQIADYKARAFEFKVEAFTNNPNYGVAITAMEVTIDMPDRTERGNNVAVANTGLAATFGRPFKETPAIGVTVNDMNFLDYYVLSGQTRTGFTINIYNSQGDGVARNIDWIAVGYGGEQ